MMTENKTEFTKNRMKIRIKIIIIILILFMAYKICFPGLPSIKTTGPYSFDTLDIQIQDNKREESFLGDGSIRKLFVTVYYPSDISIDENSCPLVVYSHGGISVNTSNVSLYEELASHGYVVVSISHTYHAIYTPVDGNRVWIDRGYLQELNTEDSNKDIANSFILFQKWMDVRIADISHIIDVFISGTTIIDNRISSLIDKRKIGLAGHSLGGAAVLGTARKRNDISAVIVLEAPYMHDVIGYDGNQFIWNMDEYTSAILNIYSDTGYALIGRDNKYVQNAKHLYNDGDIRYHYIEGSNHFTITDLVRTSPLLCRLLGGGYSRSGYDTLKVINELSLGFFSQYLFDQ